MRWFVISLFLLLTSCGREPLYQSQSYVFGTLVDVSIYGEAEPHARELAGHVLEDFQGLHNRLHAWQPSELSTLNKTFSQGGERVRVSFELAQLIAIGTELSKRSNGLFNPAIGRLIEAWGFQRDEFTPVQPDPKKIADLVKNNPQMGDIQASDTVIKNSTIETSVYSTNPGVKLDLGGIAKGYALDRAAAYLRGQGVKNALINIGGNIIALGKHGDQPWRVGIQHPRKPGPIATLDLPDGWAIGTSGDYQRYFELDGHRYCHIIDPRTGYPAQGTQAVTILVPPGKLAGTLSDAASKPIFISPQQNRAKAAQAMGIKDVLVIDAQGKISASADMAKRLQWTDKNVSPEKLF